MLKALTALIALLAGLLLVLLLLIPLLIVAIAAGPVVITLLFITGCGGSVFALGGVLLGIALSLRALAGRLTGQVRRAARSNRTT